MKSDQNKPLDVKELRRKLHYNAETGVFTWLVSPAPAVRAGSIAGKVTGKGYRQIGVNRHVYMAHRLAVLCMTGEWPAEQVDHINGARDDNRWANLRQATASQNCHNQRKPHANNASSRFLGVSWVRHCRKWQANINLNGKRTRLGLFAAEEDAYAAYLSAKRRMHPYAEVAKESA